MFLLYSIGTLIVAWMIWYLLAKMLGSKYDGYVDSHTPGHYPPSNPFKWF